MAKQMTDTEMANRWRELQKKAALQEHRRSHDRLRVIITCFSQPDPDDPADSFYIQIKATARLRKVMAEYQASHPLTRDCFDDSPRNFLPQHGSQLTITESALFSVTGYWGEDDWRDGEIHHMDIEYALDDFFYNLTQFHAKVEWAA
jgi:hypothetical protein